MREMFENRKQITSRKLKRKSQSLYGLVIRSSLKSLLLFCLIIIQVAQNTGVDAQTSTPPQVRALLSTMSPEERVGQLFLVTFQGTDTQEGTQINDLITDHHIGGVILLAGNNNIAAPPGSVQSTHQLISNLQSIEWNAALANETPRKVFVPLLVGISQEGDGSPNDQLLSGMTALPNEMAIGATWSPEIAYETGTVLGQELSSIGFNLYLGPSLDVLDAPNPSARSDLGTRVFGGDSFWVGKMGQEYISGLHRGSKNRILVVAKHFPGRGGSDRSPEEEVATVRKSLEQLKQIELSPFIAVTNASDPDAITDGLLVSHIRYQGFQGNIRATTRPVSFDTSALSAILALPQFSSWRSSGGLMVSDDLGSNAVKDFYSVGGESFLPRLVARDAFLAGNDLLYLGNITSNEGDDPYTVTLRILEFFVQEYKGDAAFAQLVDQSVERILTQKMQMYPALNIQNVISQSASLENVGVSQQTAFDAARNAVSLISPNSQELNALLPAPPNNSERIVFLTDVSSYKQCVNCQPVDSFSVDSFQRTVLRLYGPGGSGQLLPNRLTSYSFTELQNMLDGVSETDIESSLNGASWVVISLTDVRNGQVGILRRFFSEVPNLLRNKNIILFSFTAPYYLDATDISKLTAYYGLYSKQPAFVDVAARTLFQQISLPGKSPVSIPAVGYDLITAMSPDPNQVIPLKLNATGVLPAATSDPSFTAEAQIPSYQIGDSILVHAGPVLDHNEHIVPDGTVIRFTLSTRDENGNILQQEESTTLNGIAQTSFVIDKPGKVEIRAVSEPALVSEVLQFDATDEGVAVTVVVPVLSQPADASIPTTTVVPVDNLISPEGYPRSGIWLIVLLGVLGSASLTYWAISRVISVQWGVRFGLSVMIGGFGAYNYLALGLPYSLNWISSGSGGPFGVLLFTLAGEAVGIIFAWVWLRWFNGSTSQAN